MKNYRLFHYMDKWNLWCIFLLFFSASSYAQQPGRITGTVTETGTNEPLIGVSVLIKGTQTGASTDAEGKFAITASKGQTLVFRYIGFADKEVVVGDNPVIDVVMSSNQEQLQEVVVVGYGTQRKAAVATATGSVQGENIAERGTVSPLQAVQGQVAGVDISAGSGRAGAGYNIQIRGQNSLAGGQPLYVVDGVIVSDINFLNPQDIAKLDILKDAASTAIYGSRGSNGVVLVTTKGGNTVKGGATISYDGYAGVRKNARMPDFMTGPEWWQYRQNTYITPELLAGRSNYDNTIGSLGNQGILQKVANNEYTDWRSLVMQDGTQANHWLTVSGTSNNNMQYLIGAGYQNEKGNLINEQLQRYNFKASLDHKLNDKWAAGASFNFSLTELERGSDLAVTNAFRMSPIFSPYDAQGNLVFRPGQIPNTGTNPVTTTSFTSSVNPLLDNANSQNNTRRNFGVGNIYLQFSPAKWIDVRSTFSPRVEFERNGRFWGSQTENRGGLAPAALRTNSEAFSYIMDNMVTIKKNIKEHDFNFTGLFSLQRDRVEGDSTRVTNLPYNSSFYNLGSTSTRELASSRFNQVSLISYMARLNYAFRDKYFVTLATRLDGSSKLSEGNKWSSFPSAAVAWRLSSEPFLKDATFLSDLKARFSVGVAGNNNNINAYETQMNLSDPYYYDFNGSPALGLAPNRLPNPQLTWERTTEYDFGLDFAFFKGRISGTFDVYDKLSKGVLMSRDIAIETGWTSVKDNVGSVSNKGIEFSLQTVNVATKDLTWSTTFNFSRNKNAIRELLDQKVDLPGNSWFIGQPINVNYNYVLDGIWQESERAAAAVYKQLPGQARVRDLDNNQIIDGNDRQIIGQRDPKWTGGFSTSLTYKRFDLSASIFARQGTNVLSSFHQEFTNLADRGRSKLNVDYYMAENPVTPTNYTNAYPQPANVGPYWSQVGYFKDASFVKVQNILLGYNLPSSLLDKVKLKNLRVYANVLNPFIWTDYDGFDPEYAGESLNNTGVSTVTYQVGVNAKF